MTILENLDVVHFKYNGRIKISKGLNRTQPGIYIEIKKVGFVAMLVNGKVTLVPFLHFANKFGYVSSRPLWADAEESIVDILSRIGMTYKKPENFVLEILGAKDVNQNVLKYCVEKGWLSA